MSMTTNQHNAASLGSYFVKLFEVDADQFQLAQKPRADRDCNRPYELSDLMRATAAGIWPRSSLEKCRRNNARGDESRYPAAKARFASSNVTANRIA